MKNITFILVQIDDLNHKFDCLDQLRENGWVYPAEPVDEIQLDSSSTSNETDVSLSAPSSQEASLLFFSPQSAVSNLSLNFSKMTTARKRFSFTRASIMSPVYFGDDEEDEESSGESVIKEELVDEVLPSSQTTRHGIYN